MSTLDLVICYLALIAGFTIIILALNSRITQHNKRLYHLESEIESIKHNCPCDKVTVKPKINSYRCPVCSNLILSSENCNVCSSCGVTFDWTGIK